MEQADGEFLGVTAANFLAEDHHVHSTFSDGASTIQENLATAGARGLAVLRLVDHVRSTTTWLPEFLAVVRRVPTPAGLTVLSGVEAKMLDSHGRLDMPARAVDAGRVLIADHQYPSASGPLTPEVVRARLADGSLTADGVVDTLVEATARAMHRVDRGQLAHLFSLLPKLGLTENWVSDQHRRVLAEVAVRTGTLVEVNEKWGSPSPRTLRTFRAAGVVLVTSTDSHHHRDIGRYRRVRTIMREAGAET